MTNPDGSPREALAAHLRALHEAAGHPSTRSLAARSDFISHTTISEALTGKRVPAWKTLQLLVELLGGDPAAVQPLWLQCQEPRPGRASKAAALVERVTGGPWFVVVNDLIGGWAVSTSPFPLSQHRGRVIADFMRRDDAEFCAQMRNAYTANTTPEPIRSAPADQIGIQDDGTLYLKPPAERS